MNEAKFTCEQPTAVAQEALWLAWQACGGPSGMGVFQDHPGATKQDVIANVVGQGDYPGKPLSSKKEINADYVFGRMMKLSFSIAKDGLLYSEYAPTPDYQSWCRTYPTYEALFQAAASSLARGES